MTIIESVKRFILQCPYLDELKSVNVDFLSDKVNTYSIEELPTDTVRKKYLDGTKECQFVFALMARFTYNEEIKNNIENSGFFEDFQNWLDECTENDIYPDMPDGMTPFEIKALTNGYLMGVGNNSRDAVYQIQCRLLYDKE